MGVKILSLSDTVGSSTSDVISYLFSNLIPNIQILSLEPTYILHLTNGSKIDAAYKAGCIRYDGAIQGFGCPS
jgi:hydroxymethylglutaryl-CoA lyase